MLKILIAEDDYASRTYLYKLLSSFGKCHLTNNGIEAVDAYMISLEEGDPYDLVFLDIMMPKVDGLRAVKAIRDIEKRAGAKDLSPATIILVSALDDEAGISESIRQLYDAYLTKPVDKETFIRLFHSFGISC